jgi:ribosomal protein S18 acetylase RimI-like enzyme
VSVDFHIREASLTDARDAAGIVHIIDSYAADPKGGGTPLPSHVKDRMVPVLRAHPTTLVLLAFAAEEPIGIAVCFYGVSTFRARPLLNIHDLAVLPEYRGRGVGRALLAAVEEHARRKGCCKLTLEVQDQNTRARALYQQVGFEDVVIAGSATRFLAKPLEG